MPLMQNTEDEDNEELMNKPLDPRLVQFLQGTRINSDRGAAANYMAAQAKAMAQLGTLGGKASDTSAVSDMAQGIAKGAAVDQAADQDIMDRDTKLKQYLLGLKQQKQLRADDLAFRDKQEMNRVADRNADNALAQQRHEDLLKQQKAQLGLGYAQLNQKGARGDSYEKTDMVSDDGVPLVYNKTSGSYEKAKLPEGVTASKNRSGKEPTAEQFKAGAFAHRLEQAESDFEDLVKQGYNRASTKSAVANAIIPESFSSDQSKRQTQAERNFLTAVLRRESGASISPSEFDTGEKMYFPRANDSKELLEQKKRNRDQVIASMRAEGGNAYDRIPSVPRPEPKAPKQEPGTATAAPAGPAVGTEEGGFRFKGGDPADEANWEKIK